jgi:hypothetical protein
MAQESHTPTKRQRNPDLHITPVTIHFNDGGHSFKNISIPQRESLRKLICEAAGNPKIATVLRGGDLAVIPHDQSQQTSLLGIKTLLGRPVTCTVPNSSLANKNGVIFGVPISDTEEDIL